MKIETKPLSLALEKVKRIHGDARRTLPILSCVKLSAENGILEISASDLDQFQIERVECDGNLAPTCVNQNYIAGAIGGESVTLEMSGDSLEVTSGFGTTKLPTMDAGEFPSIPTLEKGENHGVNCQELGKAIDLVSFAASTEAVRYILNSVYACGESKTLSAVSTNGRELAVVESALIGSAFKIVAPSAFAGNLCSALMRDGASFSSSSSWMLVRHAAGSYYCKQLEGKYPNWKQVVPAKKTKLGTVSTGDFKQLVGRCLVFTDQSEAGAKFEFSKSKLTIKFIGDKNAQVEHSIDGSFKDFTIELNARAFHKTLSAIKAESIDLFHSGDCLSPIRIEAGDLVILAMPMRPR